MTITESAKQKLEPLTGEGAFFVISLEGGGCSGLMINLDLRTSLPSTALNIDERLNVYWACAVTKEHLQGGQLSYDKDVMSEGFNLKLPPDTVSCGCGASIQMGERCG